MHFAICVLFLFFCKYDHPPHVAVTGKIFKKMDTFSNTHTLLLN